MVPIIFTKNVELDENTLAEYFWDLCKKHKQENRALAFAFLVYDFENPEIINVIQNTKYWSALDYISGKYLSVFYIDSKDSYYEKRQKEIKKEEASDVRNKYPGNVLLHMHSLNIHDTPASKAISYLKKEFGIKETISHPFIIFFQTNDDKLENSFIVNLKQEKIEESFLEIKNLLKNAKEALEKIEYENIGNTSEIFSLIKNNIENAKINKFIKTNITHALKVDKLFSFVRFIAGAGS